MGDQSHVWDYELQRRKSFKKWRNISPELSAENIAAQGFYYTGESDTVCCAFCHIYISHWTKTDNPREVHKNANPNCRFILKRLTHNVTIANERGDWMLLYDDRLKSFNDGDEENASTLAEQGFFQDINGYVQCVFCKMILDSVSRKPCHMDFCPKWYKQEKVKEDESSIVWEEEV
ncbi:E3 ubiquitin-protein ligase XIAP-like [Nilaparvata lugens]|uniref:E3 ubiquitin-protein ligase XIAP-like n=1 Tax=Nilaparvata lugens TaxID=108931 RepID=UPI00193CA1FC|nr:E3 ubiquitin-protein ligase XIAP-like [Nilaparvata lugens]